MEEPTSTRGTLESVVALQTLGVQLILVHGGGKPIDRAMERAGIKPVKVQGRRYTDDATLEIVVQVLSELNAGIVQQIRELGGSASGFHAANTFPLKGQRLMLPGLDLQPIDLGRVGEVTKVNLDSFELPRSIPVLPSLAIDTDGGWLNVNADTVAAAVAGASNARDVLFLTDTPGVLRDVRDANSVVPELTRAECEQLIRDGVIAGGMIPKVEACLVALDAGAKRAVILDGRNPYALLGEFIADATIGTAIVR